MLENTEKSKLFLLKSEHKLIKRYHTLYTSAHRELRLTTLINLRCWHTFDKECQCSCPYKPAREYAPTREKVACTRTHTQLHQVAFCTQTVQYNIFLLRRTNICIFLLTIYRFLSFLTVNKGFCFSLLARAVDKQMVSVFLSGVFITFL